MHNLNEQQTRYYKHLHQHDSNSDLYWFNCCQEFLPESYILECNIIDQLEHLKNSEMLYEFDLWNNNEVSFCLPDGAPTLGSRVKILLVSNPKIQFVKPPLTSGKRYYLTNDIFEKDSTTFFHRLKMRGDNNIEDILKSYQSGDDCIITDLRRYRNNEAMWNNMQSMGTSFYRDENTPNIFTHYMRFVLLNVEGEVIHEFKI